MLSKEQYDGVAEPAKDELYAISGSGFGFPSNRYIDLTLGASGATYTAPANGWLYLRISMNNAYGYLEWQNKTAGMVQTSNTYGGTPYKGTIFPAKKGDSVQLNYAANNTSSSNPVIFRFIYAEGEE